MTTDKLENAEAFAKALSHEGDVRTILNQAKGACRTLLVEVERLRAKLDYVQSHIQRMGCHAASQVERSCPDPAWIGYLRAAQDFSAEIDRYDAAKKESSCEE